MDAERQAEGESEREARRKARRNAESQREADREASREEDKALSAHGLLLRAVVEVTVIIEVYTVGACEWDGDVMGMDGMEYHSHHGNTHVCVPPHTARHKTWRLCSRYSPVALAPRFIIFACILVKLKNLLTSSPSLHYACIL